MAKSITKIVLTGGPAAGKTSLISRILKEFTRENGWKVITIPETATELISGFGIKPFDNCVSMLDFQYFVISDQLHKERLAIKGAEMVPEEKVLIIYDRALFDDKAYINDEEFRDILAYYGTNEETVLQGYDAVLHLVTCAKGAEFAYDYGNAARYEDVATAREKDDLTIRAWSKHPNVHIIDNSQNFEDKLNRAIAEIYRILGEPAPAANKNKYLVKMPDTSVLEQKYNALAIEMMQTYLTVTNPMIRRRIRQQRSGSDYLYFYTEKRTNADGSAWVTERPISNKEYVSYLMEADLSLHPVRKVKYRFNLSERKMELDVYPFSEDKAVFFVYGENPGAVELPEEITIIKDVTGDPAYKNRMLAARQEL